MNTNEEPVIVEATFKASPDIVWDAITIINQMRQWYFDNIPAFKPEVGFQTKFNVNSQNRNFLHIWEITEVLPQNRITYSWRYDEYPGDSYVVFELFKEKNYTKLRVIHKVTESFPDDIPEFKRESCLGGWEYLVKKRLKEFLEKDS